MKGHISDKKSVVIQTLLLAYQIFKPKLLHPGSYQNAFLGSYVEIVEISRQTRNGLDSMQGRGLNPALVLG
jgi:hypothetical protein